MNRLVAFALGSLLAGWPGGLAAVGLITVVGGVGWRRTVEIDVVGVATLLLVRVGAGMPLIPALAAAAGDDPEIEAVARRSRRIGSAAALASASGPLAPLLRGLADAAISGAPPEPAIRSFLDSERRRRHTSAIERARRLPVRLMIPMTLLVLPGFVLMVYGPAFIGMIRDLAGPLAP
jgi:hypothetical protein